MGFSLFYTFYTYVMREFFTRFARFLAVSDKQAKIWAVHLLTSMLHNACQPKVTPLYCSMGVLCSPIVSMTLPWCFM